MFIPFNRAKSLSRAMRRAAIIVAADQGLEVETEDEVVEIKLGSSSVYGRKASISERNSKGRVISRRTAPPEIYGPTDVDAFSDGTLEEFRMRLAVVFLLLVLVPILGDERDIDTVPAALCFAKDAYGIEKIDWLLAEKDFVAWRVLDGDVSAWFDLHFAHTRVSAI